MRKTAELPLLGSWNQRTAAIGFMVLGAAGASLGLGASGAFATPPRPPAIHERVINTPPEVFQMAGQLCVDGAVYGVVDHRVEPLPDSACNESSTSGGVSVAP